MSTELEHRSDAELRELADAPARAAAELARRETERQLAPALEAEARTAGEVWLSKAVLAVKKLAGQLDEMLERLRANPNKRDLGAANAIWARVVAYVELADVVARRFPGIMVAAMPTVTPPGRRGLDDVPGLSIATPARQLHPVILASDSAELRAALFKRAAYEWLIGRGSDLPEELRGTIAVAAPEPELSARVALQRAETRRRNEAVMRATRTW